MSDVLERFDSRAVDANIHLRGSVQFGLPPVLADRERISHVFDNLLGNALAHTGRGGSVELSAEVVDQLVIFSVRDTGEGIAPEYVPRIFDRFFRVAGSRTTHGAGLGLAIAKEIVMAHNGRIDVTSREGVGSTFTFTLPVAPEGAGADQAKGTAS